jgi:hypothetical protein
VTDNPRKCGELLQQGNGGAEMLCGFVLGGSAQAADLEVFKTSSGNIVSELDNGEIPGSARKQS